LFLRQLIFRQLFSDVVPMVAGRGRMGCLSSAPLSEDCTMRNRKTIAVLMAGLTLGFAAQAAEPQDQAPTNVTYAGVTVGIDPATGKLRPLTAAENKAMSDALLRGNKQAARYGNQPRNAQEAGASRRVHADGGVSIKVPADQMSQLEATVGADGQVTLYEGAAPAVRKEEVK
jgi:hypothetical protein